MGKWGGFVFGGKNGGGRLKESWAGGGALGWEQDWDWEGEV